MSGDLPPLSQFRDRDLTDGVHLLPDDAWAAVVADAEREAERIAAGQQPGGRFGTGLNLPLSGVVTAPDAGGYRGRPTFGVIHSAETPLRAGCAAAIARYFASGPGTSCHYMTDPAETWGVLPDTRVAYHVGGANPRSIGLEQSGYARFTRAQWLAAEGVAQMKRNGQVMRAARAQYGIGLYRMTDQQLRDAHAGRIIGGWTDHNTCRRVIGGTSHTDPGAGFPWDVQLQLAADVPAPRPTPAPTAGGRPMKVIHAPGADRGYALVGAGYFCKLRDEEDATQQQNLWGPAVRGNERQWDLWRAAALGGQATRPMAAAARSVVQAAARLRSRR